MLSGKLQRHPGHGIQWGHVRPTYGLQSKGTVVFRVADVIVFLRLPIEVLCKYLSLRVQQLAAHEENVSRIRKTRQSHRMDGATGIDLKILCVTVIAQLALEVIHPD